MSGIRTGWVLGIQSLWTTRDGGATWTRLPAPALESGDFFSAGFLGGPSEWLFTGASQLFESEDSGIHWTPQALPTAAGVLGAAWSSPGFGRFWIGGGIYQPGAGPEGPNYAIKHYDSGAWGILAAAVFTRNSSNAEWGTHPLPDCAYRIFELRFWNERRGMAAGDDDCFYMTSDGGNTWTVSNLQAPDQNASGSRDDNGVPSTFFRNPDIGWLSTQSGFYHTTDGGKNWQKIAGETPYFNALAFVDSLHGYAIARQSELYESRDGGRIWKQILLNFVPRTIYFRNGTGWLLSDSKLYRILNR